MPTRLLIVAAGATLALAVAIHAMDTEPAGEPAPEPAPQTEAPAQPPAPEPAEGPFDRLLLDHAAKYREWKRVSDDAYFSPLMCLAPPPTGALKSHSNDTATHGRKLYYLYASDTSMYARVNWAISKIEAGRGAPRFHDKATGASLTLVKETWKPVPADDDGDAATSAKSILKGLLPRSRGDDGKDYVPGEQADLFIMAKLDPETPNTDNGWVYGVVSSDGHRVLAAGAIESCMKCHVKAPVDRLFGLPWAQAEREQREQLEQEKAATPAEDR